MKHGIVLSDQCVYPILILMKARRFLQCFKRSEINFNFVMKIRRRHFFGSRSHAKKIAKLNQNHDRDLNILNAELKKNPNKVLLRDQKLSTMETSTQSMPARKSMTKRDSHANLFSKFSSANFEESQKEILNVKEKTRIWRWWLLHGCL